MPFNQFSDLSEVDQLTHDEIIDMWCQELEQHPERQGYGRLDLRGFRCCLGELSYIGSLFGVCKRKTPTDREIPVTYDKEVHYPPRSIVNWAKLTDFAGSFKGKSDDLGRSPGEKRDTVSSLNDRGATWPELAKLIRSKPKGLFTI